MVDSPYPSNQRLSPQETI